MPRTRERWREFARSEDEARAVRSVLRSYLICPYCGVTEQKITDALKTKSAFTMKCGGCALKYIVRRRDLAEHARRQAETETDPTRADILRRVARLFAPVPHARHADPLPAHA